MLLPGKNTLIIIHSPANREVRLFYPAELSDKPLAIKPAKFVSKAALSAGAFLFRVLYMVQTGTGHWTR